MFYIHYFQSIKNSNWEENIAAVKKKYIQLKIVNKTGTRMYTCIQLKNKYNIKKNKKINHFKLTFPCAGCQRKHFSIKK